MATSELEAFIDETIRLARENDYNPTTFIGMRQNHGTISAITRLVKSGNIQGGFLRLEELGLIKWTIEAAVMKFPSEFSPGIKDAAEWRLEQAKAKDQ